MPYIHTTANVAISAAQAENMKAKFGKAIESVPGKSEAWLMVGFEENTPMYFQGTAAACALISVSLYGALNPAAADKMTALVTDIISTELGIAPSRIYVKYDATDTWGWNGGNF